MPDFAGTGLPSKTLVDAVPVAHIEAARSALEGTAGALGAPSGAARLLSDRVTAYQAFLTGAIFSSPAFGTFRVSQTANAKWVATAALRTADGQDVQTYLGAVVAAPTAIGTGGEFVAFERGAIVVRPTGGTFVIYGAVYLRYRSYGGVTGLLGLPTSDEQPVVNGRRSQFDFGDIYWRSDLGAHEVHGAIRDRLNAIGGVASFGFPTSDETPVMKNGVELGRRNSFESGRSIYWSGSTGAWDVYGAIKATWDSYGGATGSLGFPITGETDTPGGDGGRFNDFANGVIVWHPSGPYAGTFPFWSLPFYVDSFQSDFDDIHVQANVVASTGQTYATWIPSPGSYASNPRVGADVFTIPIVHSTLSISIWFDGLGDHTFGKDERLGRYAGTLDITNLWGALDPPDHAANQDQNSDHSFTCRFSTKPAVPIPPNTPFRASQYWPFDNFSTAELSWSQFAQTFTDVAEDESTFWHPFDHLFYELVYKTVCANGNCFGMCLESVYASVDRSLFPEPIYNNPFIQYPANLQGGAKPNPASAPGDVRFTEPINLRHGYQIGAEMINYFVETFVSGRTHDPVKAFLESQASFAAGDFPVLSMSKDYFFGGAHVVRPYEWHQDTNPWTIKVANPNAPYSTNPNDDALSVISIDPHANTFSFQEGWSDDNPPKPTIYSGGEWSGGRLFSIPYSVVAGPPHTCFWEVMALLVSGTLLLLGDDATTSQITDEYGHTFLSVPEAVAMPSGLVQRPSLVIGTRTINENAETRIPNFAPVPLLSQFGHTVSEVAQNDLRFVPQAAVATAYYHRPIPYGNPPPPPHAPPAAPAGGEHVGQLTDVAVNRLLPKTPSLEHEISSASGSYRWGIRSAVLSVVATVTGGSAGTDVMHLASPGQPGAAVTFRAGSAKTAAVQIVGPLAGGASAAKIYEIDGLPLGPANAVSVRLDAGGSEMIVDNSGPQATVSLRFQAGPLSQNAAVRTGVVLEAGKSHRFTPSDWTIANIAKAQIALNLYDLGGTAVVATRTL